MITGHGDDIYLINKPIVANFSSNVYFNAKTDILFEYIKTNMHLLKNYPEVDANSLKIKLSQMHCIPRNNVISTNGATEAIYIIAQAFRKCRSLIFIPSFSEYEDACKLNKHTIIYENNSMSIQNIDYSQYDCVWICNPNNPDGKIFDKKYLSTVIKKNPNTVFIIDESYSDFVIDKISLVDCIDKYSNLIIIKSFTKKYSIPGIRLGYIIISSQLYDNIKKYMQPWNLNVMALIAGKYIIDNIEKFEIDTQTWINNSREMQSKISSIPGFCVIKSKTPYFIVEKLHTKASVLKQSLIANHSFLIRDASNFRGLSDNSFRICSQGKELDGKLTKILKEEF